MRNRWYQVASFICATIFLILSIIVFVMYGVLVGDLYFAIVLFALLMPFISGVLFSLVSIYSNSRGWSLASAVSYILSSLLLPLLFVPLITCSILCFVYWSCNSPVVTKMIGDENNIKKLVIGGAFMSDELVFGESPKVDEEQTNDGEVFGVVNNAQVTSGQGYVEYEQESSGGIPVTETGISDETFGVNNENSVKIDQANITSLFKIGSIVLGVVFIVLFLIFIL